MDIWLPALVGIGATAFYLVSSRCLDFLETTVKPLSGPLNGVDGQTDGCFVAARGSVTECAGGQRLLSENILANGKRVIGPIQLLTVERQSIRWDPLAQDWYKRTDLLSSVYRQVPFDICTPNWVDRLHVSNPPASVRALADSGIQLPIISTTYDPNVSMDASFGQRAMEFLSGDRLIGILSTERMLAFDSPLTVIGQLQRQTDGKFHLVGTPDRPLLLSLLTYEQLLEEERVATRFSRYLLFGALAIITFFAGRRLHRWYLRWSERREMRRLLDNRKMASDDPNSATVCVICLDRQRNCIFMPCGHLVSCADCSGGVDGNEPRLNKCPLCRGDISQVFRTYIN